MIAKMTFNSIYTTIGVLLLAQAETYEVVMDPIWLFVICTCMAISGGLGSLVRTSEVITTRLVTSYLLNMGTCGASMSMLLYAALAPRELANFEYYILGAVGVFSLGGMVMIDFAISLGKTLTGRWLKHNESGKTK